VGNFCAAEIEIKCNPHYGEGTEKEKRELKTSTQITSRQNRERKELGK